MSSVKFSTVVFLSLCLSIRARLGETERLERTNEKAIINAQAIASYITCQNNARLINAALKSNVKLENIPSKHLSSENVTFLLYTRKNPSDAESLSTYNYQRRLKVSKYFNISLPVILYVHGLHQNSQLPAQVLPSKLLSKEDINLIIVDWSSYSFFDVNYGRNNTTPRLGAVIAQFGNEMIERGAAADKMHFIGYCAGAQAVGLAAKEIRPKIAKILAIDPQGNCYNFLPSSQKLTKTDANFVQIIHCTTGDTGSPLSLRGHLTFYMNGGLVQPQCKNDTVAATSLCSHLRCDDYFFDSLSETNNYIGVKCDTQIQYLFDDCDYTNVSLIGYYASTSLRGEYYVETELNKDLIG